MNDFADEMDEYINPNYKIEVSYLKHKVLINKHIRLTLDNKIIDIRGSRWDCKIKFQNGYVLKCYGELDMNHFTIYTKKLKITEKEKIILRE